jgi:hypothetical protein
MSGAVTNRRRFGREEVAALAADAGRIADFLCALRAGLHEVGNPTAVRIE